MPRLALDRFIRRQRAACSAVAHQVCRDLSECVYVCAYACATTYGVE